MICQDIMWNKLIVGLLQIGIYGLNVKLCDQNTVQISTPHPQAGPICTPSMDTPKLWSTNKLANYLDNLPPISEEHNLRI